MPQEQQRRKPEFLDDSLPVVLADGQEWFFPRPRVKFSPAKTELGFVERGYFNSEYDAAYSAMMREWRESDNLLTVVRCELHLAALLLLKNYDLSDDEVSELIQFDFTEGSSDDTRDTIIRIATGQALSPKAESAGPD